MASQDNIDLPEKVAARQLDSVEELDGHAVNQEDHELTIRQAFKTQTKAILWAFFAVWVLLLAAYDNSAPSLYLSIPEFRKSFGSPFDGDWVLDARWQSAFNAAPVATYVQTNSCLAFFEFYC